jgi:hypothetical protein
MTILPRVSPLKPVLGKFWSQKRPVRQLGSTWSIVNLVGYNRKDAARLCR